MASHHSGEVIDTDDVITNLSGQSQFDMMGQFEPCSLFSDDFESGDMAAWSS